MTEDDIITRLVELHDHIQAPATPARLDALRGERLVRRRRTVSIVAAAAVAVLTVGIAQASLSDGQHAQVPTQPSQTETPTTSDEWTPERIRAEGSPGDEMSTTESSLTTRQYSVCDGLRCDAADGPPVDMHVALEVIQDGRSAVFDLHWSSQPWVRAFDEDSVLVQDAEIRADQPVRYRLLQADGTAVQLRLLDDPAPAVPRPGVVVIDTYNAILAGSEEVYLVDDRAGTVQPLEAPDQVRYWGPNVDEFLWGVTDDCRVFWATAGTFEERQLDCSEGLDFTAGLDDDGFPDGWLRPGRMVVEEQSDPGNRTFVHVSLDSGATWQRIPVRDDETVADVLQHLG